MTAYVSDDAECRIGKLLFLEAQQWDRDRLREKCSRCDAHFTGQRLEELADEDIPEGVEVVSPFVYSDCSADQLRRLGADLKLVATRSTGFDHVDIDYCNEHGIAVANVPTYGDNTVAEHAFGLILALTRKIHRCYERTIRGDFSMEGLRGIDLKGKTFGSIGTGSIARNALRIARGFDMRCLGYDIQPDEDAARRIGFEYVDLDALLGESDVVSLHVPHNEHTHHMVDAEALGKMKRGALLVNTARGGIIDPQALLESLQDGHLGGAALDVLEAEKTIREEAEILSGSYEVDNLRAIVQNHALLRLPNVIITPHVAFNSDEAVERILQTTVDNVHAFYCGKPQHLVNEVHGPQKAGQGAE
jgi:D-lactate dehydrogenase